MKYSQRCIIGQEVNRSRRAPNLPQLLLLNTPPSPPTGFPRAQLAWGGELVSRPGEGGLSARSHRNLFTVELSCESASGQDRASGSVAIARKGCAKIRQIQEIGKSPVWTNIAFASTFFLQNYHARRDSALTFFMIVTPIDQTSNQIVFFILLLLPLKSPALSSSCSSSPLSSSSSSTR